jgi:hypothetical protein
MISIACAERTLTPQPAVSIKRATATSVAGALDQEAHYEEA